ncbi:MAG: hypothetical protein K5739_12065, partial [Lachnospiraceae bacterium]|nr:hypothetical protein [Lachnospiraceae bacterium]
MEQQRKTRVMVLGIGAATKLFIQKCAALDKIEVVGIILDEAVDEEDRESFYRELNAGLYHKVPRYELSEDSLALADITFTPEYRKIIPAKLA